MLGGGGRLIVLEEIRCPSCKKKLMTLEGRAEILCPRCKALVAVDTIDRKVYIKERQKNRTPVNK